MSKSTTDAPPPYSQSDDSSVVENTKGGVKLTEEVELSKQSSKLNPTGSLSSAATPATTITTTTTSETGGKLQIVFGTGWQCALFSSLAHVPWAAYLIPEYRTVDADALLTTEFRTPELVVTDYAMSPHGDEVVLYYNTATKNPGWKWRDSTAPNAPSYKCLKNWLTQMLTNHAERFKDVRVLFGSDAIYYATCGDEYYWRDLPSNFHTVIAQYQQVLFQLNRIKDERNADPTAARVFTDEDVSSVAGPMTLRAGHFNFDNLPPCTPSSWLPKHVAFGVGNYNVAIWPTVAFVNLPPGHPVYKRLIEKPVRAEDVQYLALSPVNAEDFAFITRQWAYSFKNRQRALDLTLYIKKHVEGWINLVPGRTAIFQTHNGNGEVTASERLGSTIVADKPDIVSTATTMTATVPVATVESREPAKQESQQKGKKPGWLSTLFRSDGKHT